MPDFTSRLEDFVLERMGETKLPGVSLALIEDGRTVYARGFGFRDVNRGLPATPRTLYGIGSVTKSFTCLAILQLQEQGRLRVDDPVQRYLPITIAPRGEAIRLHHLMTHSSGIPALAYAEAVIRYNIGASDRWVPIGSYQDMLNFVNGAEDWVHTPPGERWFYLNEGYVLLGAIIEKVSGQPYADYIREHILGALGMTRSFWTHEAATADADAAVPYVITKDKTQLPSRYLNGQLSSDGGIISSVEDMTRYLAMYLAGGKGPAGALVSRESLRAMMSPHIPLPLETYPSPQPAPVGHYGYGLSVYPNFFGHTLVGHGGSVLVSTAHMAFVPDRRVGVIVLANGSGYPLQHIAYFALASVLKEDPWTLPGLRTERALEQLTGTYETYRGTYQATVTRNGDFLQVTVRNKYTEQVVPLVPLELDPVRPRFFTLGGGQRLTVEFTSVDGEAELVYERYKLRRVGKA